MRLLLVLMSVAVLAGCASPSEKLVNSRISYKPDTGALGLELPKNASWSWLSFDQLIINPKTGATNRVSLVISNGVFKNDAHVINAATAHDVEVINAVGKAASGAVQAAISAAGKAAVPIP